MIEGPASSSLDVRFWYVSRSSLGPFSFFTGSSQGQNTSERPMAVKCGCEVPLMKKVETLYFYNKRINFTVVMSLQPSSQLEFLRS